MTTMPNADPPPLFVSDDDRPALVDHLRRRLNTISMVLGTLTAAGFTAAERAAFAETLFRAAADAERLARRLYPPEQDEEPTT
jgi:hypothetical protein